MIADERDLPYPLYSLTYITDKVIASPNETLLGWVVRSQIWDNVELAMVSRNAPYKRAIALNNNDCLAAEKLLVAEKQGQKIAVEVKSFVGTSEIEDLKNALGQYILYEKILKHQLSERLLYLAIRKAIFNRLFTEEIGQILLEDNTLKIIVFDPEEEVITKWIT